MNLLEYFILIKDINTVFPDLDLLSLTSYETTVITILLNISVWIFIFILLSIIFKIVVRFK